MAILEKATHQSWQGQALICTCRKSECWLGWHLWTLPVFCLKTLWLHSATAEASPGDAEPWSQCRQGKQVPVSVLEYSNRWGRANPLPTTAVLTRRLTTAGTPANSQTGTCCRHPLRNSRLTGCTTPWATRPKGHPVYGAQNQLRSKPHECGYWI